ncbi:MAG: diguanylate cyclase [Peptococcaceae bacterium]|nr:diguanylate cyclase [Peptococcaceae bacterium]
MHTILIVDDVPANIKILGELLKGKYEILVANNGNKAVQIARSTLPDLILMDVIMPDIDGIAACNILKQHKETAEIPIIFITAKNETDDIVKGFEAGGVDYITKPFNPSELNARVKTHLELKMSREELKNYAQQLEDLNRKLGFTNSQLNSAMEKLHVAAMTDPLTGLANRRNITEKIKTEINRFKRTQRMFSFIIADIDFFKTINDAYGHECGDYVLKYIADLMQAEIREQDMLARWGGEEFLFFVPETDLEGAKTIAEKLRAKVERFPILYADNKISLTMTFGVAIFSPTEGMDASIRNADNALYKGKARGRNRVEVSGA